MICDRNGDLMNETTNRVAAGVVLFNPNNIERVQKCLYSISSQIEKLYVFDNSNKRNEIDLPNNAEYKTLDQNMGIAYALNYIMAKAEKDGFEWVITMDQDSIMPLGIVEDFKLYFDNNIGIICPQVIDKRRAYMCVHSDTGIESIEMCITSASCTSIKAWKSVGRFDEWLFIDLVDNDFCKRLILSGYKILRLNKWVLDQEFGEIIPKSKRKQRFWIKVSYIFHNKNIAKLSYKKSINSVRVYYTCRNIIYVNKKMSNYGTIAYENYNCKNYLGFIFAFIIPSFLRSDKKWTILKSIILGTRDGKNKKVIPWNPENIAHDKGEYYENKKKAFY